MSPGQNQPWLRYFASHPPWESVDSTDSDPCGIRCSPEFPFRGFPQPWILGWKTLMWVCLKIVYLMTQWFCWSLSLLNGYNWGYTLFSDKPMYHFYPFLFFSLCQNLTKLDIRLAVQKIRSQRLISCAFEPRNLETEFVEKPTHLEHGTFIHLQLPGTFFSNCHVFFICFDSENLCFLFQHGEPWPCVCGEQSQAASWEVEHS